MLLTTKGFAEHEAHEEKRSIVFVSFVSCRGAAFVVSDEKVARSTSSVRPIVAS
jgi:hypothetical protein